MNYKTIGRFYEEVAAANRTEPAVYRHDDASTSGDATDDITTYGRSSTAPASSVTGGSVTLTQVTAPDIVVPTNSERGNGAFNVFTPSGLEDDASTMDIDESLHATARSLKTYLDAWGKAVAALRSSTDDADVAYVKTYDDFVASANAAALPAAIKAAEVAHAAALKVHEGALEAFEKDPMHPTAGDNVKIERDAWMVSGKIKFGGPVDFRFSYMDADDLEVSCESCLGDWDETAADAWNVGIFYTMPAGTELRLTYSEVDNDEQGTYGQGISTTGLGTPGNQVECLQSVSCTGLTDSV